MFRFFHFVVFIFLAQGVFAQFPAFKWVSCYLTNPFDVSLEERFPGNNFIEKQDSIYYVQVGGYISEGCNQTPIVSKTLLNKKSKGKNLMVCYNETKEDVFACWFSGRDIMFQCLISGGGGWLPEENFLIGTNIGSEYKMDNMSFRNLPFIICDKSKGEFKGRIYVCYTDTKYSTEDKDVFLIYSDDKGETWTEPILVTYRPNHKAQFAVQMAIDPCGVLYLLYYDKQNSVDGELTDLTLAVSKNGGLKFDYYKVNEKSFRLSDDDIPPYLLNIYCINNHNPSEFFWRQDNNCYYVRLDDSSYAANNKALTVLENFIQIPKTVSFSEKISLPIELQDTTTITAVITKPLDPYFERVVFTGKKFKKGKHEIVLNTKQLGLEKGNYTLFLYYKAHNKFVWVVEE